MTIRQLKTGQLSPKQLDCAFLWLYTLEGQPYGKYLPAGAPATMPMALTQLRWDGRIGTMGGKVASGESLREALTRECTEEANFWLSSDAELQALGTFQDGDWHIHSFALEVPYLELMDIRARASALSSASPECAGWMVAPLGDYKPGDNGPRGVTAFRQNHFASTAGLEFDTLLASIQQRHAQQVTRNLVLDRLRRLYEHAVASHSGASFFLTPEESKVITREDIEALQVKTGYRAMCAGSAVHADSRAA